MTDHATERPIAYVMEQTLGSVTHYLNLRQQDALPDGGGRRWIPIDYEAGKLPWTVTGSLRARRALGPALAEVDGIFMHTTTLAPLAVDYFRKKPAVLSTDGTPMNKRAMRTAYGLKQESSFAEQAKRELYRAIFRRARGFVAWSNWAKQSFVDDYGCPEAHVAVIPPGIALDRFTAGDRNHELPRMLFVGGDFERKGGDLLLEVFRRRFRGRAELELVTRKELPAEDGVRVHQNVQANSDTLRNLYATSDIFVLPTRADCYSLVGMEALAAGLPIVLTDVGGIPDIVRQNETGFLVKPDDADALGDALETLIANPALRATMGTRARQDAALRFDARENALRLFRFVRSRC
jgi:glycosyltransferase involved in cell wall biosynthesis